MGITQNKGRNHGHFLSKAVQNQDVMISVFFAIYILLKIFSEIFLLLHFVYKYLNLILGGKMPRVFLLKCS